MGCCGGREKDWEVKPAQKWDYINLSDFKSSSCMTGFSYGILWIMLGVSVACYVIDFSTMINLLLWSKFGSNSISPPAPWGIEAIPKWVFTGCIILSYVLLIYRWWKAIRAMRSGGVAKSYLDPLAVRIQSIRLGKTGRGYRRFLVFAELTKSKHGTEYIALFVYFAFEASVRIVLAEGPRNAINVYTVVWLCQQWADPKNSPDKAINDSAIQKFWAAALAQANDNRLRAAVFLGMIFTIIVWVIAAIGLIVACILYIVFLWHHIPQQDGGLRGYCKRKVDKSVSKIVGEKIKKALAEEQKQQGKKKGGKGNKNALPEAPADLKRQPTLPVLMQEENGDLPMYSTGPNTPGSGLDRQPTLPDMNAAPFTRPGMGARNMTGTSNTSYGSDAPLLHDAAAPGHADPGRSYSPGPGSTIGRSYSPGPGSTIGRSYSPVNGNGRSASPAPPRPFTPTGELVMDRAGSPAPGRSYTPAAGAMPPFVPGARPGPPHRSNTSYSEASSGGPGSVRQLTPANGGMGRGPPGGPPGAPAPYGMLRAGSAMSAPAGPPNGRGTPMQQQAPPPRSNTAGPYGPNNNMQGRQSPASFSRPGPGAYNRAPPGRSTPVQEFEMQPQARTGPPPPIAAGGYQAYRPGGTQSPATPVGAAQPLLPPQNHHDQYTPYSDGAPRYTDDGPNGHNNQGPRW